MREQCPSLVALERLNAGSLPDASLAILEEHVDHCESCQRVLDGMPAKPLVCLPASRICEREDQEPGLKRAIESLKQHPLAPPLTEEDSENFTQRLLQPSEKPGVLGLLDTYEVLEPIGAGGMGRVYKAYDPSLDRFVAIKIIAPQMSASKAARIRFAREARAAAAISQENVVQIYAVKEIEGVPYLVMEYVEGASLQQRLDSEARFELGEILEIGRQTALGLAAAHACGLIHRDIKPANILLPGASGRVKLTDFGLARSIDDASVTQSGVLAGTPQFMAPEQARGEGQDHRVDLFSLGSVLYTLCTGQPPFRAATSMAVLRLVSDSQPEQLRKLNPEIPEWLERFIATLHAKDPEDRFQSAEDVARMLEQYREHLESPATIAAPAWQNPNRRDLDRDVRRKLVPALAGFLLVFAGFLASISPAWRNASAASNDGGSETISRQAVAPATGEWDEQVSLTNTQAALAKEQQARKEAEKNLARLTEAVRGYFGKRPGQNTEAELSHIETALRHNAGGGKLSPADRQIRGAAALNREKIQSIRFEGDNLIVIGKDGTRAQYRLGDSEVILMLLDQRQRADASPGSTNRPEVLPHEPYPVRNKSHEL